MSKPIYGIIITFADVANNEFLCLGGAAWLSRREQKQKWAAIPVSAEETWLMAELRAANDDIEKEKEVSWATVEQLLGKPLQTLIARARAELRDEEISR